MTYAFHLENFSILCLKDEYVTRGASCFKLYSRCYVTWWLLTMGIVGSLRPSSKDAVLVSPNTFNVDGLNAVKTILPQ